MYIHIYLYAHTIKCWGVGIHWYWVLESPDWTHLAITRMKSMKWHRQLLHPLVFQRKHDHFPKNQFIANVWYFAKIKRWRSKYIHVYIYIYYICICIYKYVYSIIYIYINMYIYISYNIVSPSKGHNAQPLFSFQIDSPVAGLRVGDTYLGSWIQATVTLV